MQVTDKVVVVTGGAHGIGAAMVRRFVAEGAAGVLVADLDGPAADHLAQQATTPRVPVIARRVDVSQETEVAAMVSAAEEALGPVDVVCSNAGIGTGEGLDAPAEAWARAWEVNLMAHVHAARAVLPGMLERGGGALVHTCSAAGLLTMIGDAPYTVTKHAAVAFAEWLAVTYGPRGIHVSALCPQGVRTQLLEQDAGAVAARAVRLAGAVLEPDDVAEAVVQGLAQERFLILPHPEVAEHWRRKATDPQRWIAALQGMAARLDETAP